MIIRIVTLDNKEMILSIREISFRTNALPIKDGSLGATVNKAIAEEFINLGLGDKILIEKRIYQKKKG